MQNIKIVSPTGVEEIRSDVAVTFYPADSWRGSSSSRVIYYQKGDAWCKTIDRGTVYVLSEFGAILAKYMLGPSIIEDSNRKAATESCPDEERKRGRQAGDVPLDPGRRGSYACEHSSCV